MERDSDPYGEYKGYTAQEPSSTYSEEEMPRSTYPQQPDVPPTYASATAEPPYEHQQAGYQQQQQQYQYGQQQQQYTPPQGSQGQPFYGQSPIGNIGSDEKSSTGMKARTAALLACLFGWAGGVVFFFLEKESRFVRFYAIQSILFFGIFSIIQSILNNAAIIGGLRGIPGIIMFIGWLILLNATRQGKVYKFPIIGDYAEKLVDRLR